MADRRSALVCASGKPHISPIKDGIRAKWYVYPAVSFPGHYGSACKTLKSAYSCAKKEHELARYWRSSPIHAHKMPPLRKLTSA